MKFAIRFAAVVIILAGLGIAGYTAFRSSDKADSHPVFADRTMLAGLYSSYKQNYWQPNTGRTIDKQQNSITTSEGQSYTMLRAVWQSDKPTFDKTWAWTQQQLQRQDKLFAWRWGQKSDGTSGVLSDQGGENTASDADSDIALSLLMAANRWQQSSYLNDAKAIIPEIWTHEVITVQGKPYLASNNLEKSSAAGAAIINPSYFAPYAYRLFSKVDDTHDWNALVDSSYSLINEAMDAKLDVSKSADLVPDWVMLDKTTGELSAPTASDGSNLTTHYSYDAMRTDWRLALDYEWNKEPRAKATLQKMSFLGDQWSANHKIVATYSHDGSALTSDEPPESYGTSLGYFMVANPTQAKDVYQKKLVSLYNQNDNSWNQPMNYYSDNWAWFGMALYNHQLDDLAKS